MQLRPAFLAVFMSFACARLQAEAQGEAQADDQVSVTTRHGAVRVIPASEERSALLFNNKPVARMNGDASLHKLAIRSERDYVLADAMAPGLNCKHEFILLEIGAGDAPSVSAPFGQCMTLFGARLQDGKAVVQLEEAVADAQGQRRVHEFAFAGGRLEELPGVLDYCEASSRAAGSIAVALTPDVANKTVAGSGRAYFHSAPQEACRTPKVFLVPGDKVRAERETDAFVEIEYRHPKSGQVFKGWLRRDRLLDPAQ